MQLAIEFEFEMHRWEYTTHWDLDALNCENMWNFIQQSNPIYYIAHEFEIQFVVDVENTL